MKAHQCGLPKKGPVLCLLLLLVGFSAAQAATTLVNYNFDSLNPGAISGQDSWKLASSAVSPIISANNSSTGYSDLTNVVGKASESTRAPITKNSTFFSSGSWNSSSVVTLTFDVYAGVASSNRVLELVGPVMVGKYYLRRYDV